MTSSYFSEYEETLDPTLFVNDDTLRQDIRNALLGMVEGTLSQHFTMPAAWSRAWIAGSGVSYQWSAARDPGDLDVLVGVDYVGFRQSNPQYRGLSDVEISKQINEVFRTHLMPQTTNWSGFEVTFYVNADGWEITNLKPYAAYSLTDDSWTVAPERAHRETPKEWEEEALSVAALAQSAIQWYSLAYTDLQNAPHDAARVNAERALQSSLEQASAIFDRVHEGRKIAFGFGGQGYDDRHNFLWQAAKRDGWLNPIRELRDYAAKLRENNNISTYGVELPDTETLIRRAATAYANYPGQ